MKIECVICFEKIRADCLSLACGHIFHEACLRQWQTRAVHCPSCRQVFTANQFRKIFLTNQSRRDSDIFNSTVVANYQELQEDLLSTQSLLELQNSQLQEENNELKKENHGLKEENEKLKNKIWMMEKNIAKQDDMKYADIMNALL